MPRPRRAKGGESTGSGSWIKRAQPTPYAQQVHRLSSYRDANGREQWLDEIQPGNRVVLLTGFEDGSLDPEAYAARLRTTGATVFVREGGI
jgi:hypothetical protein